jgi:peptidylprolyl isomerase
MSKSKSRRPKAKPQSALRRNWVAYSAAGVIILVAGFIIYSVIQSNVGAAGGTPGVKSWASAPAMSIDVNKQYTAHIDTVKGTVDVQLLPKAAPIAVNSFVFLARQHYFDGVTFHRVIPGFMAQGGDPTGTGGGGPGYTFDNEVSSGLTFDAAGVMAMANTGQPNSNGSQFFITYAPQPGLNGGYTIFGKVLSGMDVVQALTPRDPTQNPTFTGDVIKTITIDEK